MNDARGIAQLTRTGWFRPFTSNRARRRLRMLLGRVLGIENMVRCLIRPFGLKVGQISIGKFDSSSRCSPRARGCVCSSPVCTGWR
jgi:hypothetical protein